MRAAAAPEGWCPDIGRETDTDAPDAADAAASRLLAATVSQISRPDPAVRAAARARLEQLTMPHWALGRLLDLAEDLAGMTGQVRPDLSHKTVVLMAADHGVSAEGVSAYPSAVTGQMVRNFIRGGAAINALAGVAGAGVVVVDLGVAADLADLAPDPAFRSFRIRPGTWNIARGPAMSRAEAIRSVAAGIAVAGQYAEQTAVFGTGEMGIGNTTPASAIVAALCGAAPAEVTGRGTGVGDERLRNKIKVVERSLAENTPDPADGLDVLAKVGGFEIGGLAGVILGAAVWRRPVLIDGFIATAAALIADRLAPAAREYMIAAHRSAEPGHRLALERLAKRPLLDLDLRLGEGTGAALAMPLVDAAVAVLTQVATFAEATVSEATVSEASATRVPGADALDADRNPS